MSSDDEMGPPRLSRTAFIVMGLLVDRGGTMRIGPLLAASRLDGATLAGAVNELFDRCWVEIVWRGPDAPPADAPATQALPSFLQPVRRIVTTRFGRWRYPRCWSEVGE
jgi:hypothetical protein